MSNKQFLIRLVIWFVAAVVVPFSYVAIRFGLFTESTGKSLSGWGLVAIIFVAIMMIIILAQTRNCLPKGSMFRQCLSGLMALIPFFAVILFIHQMKSVMDEFEKFLIVTLVSEAIAVPVNPLPRWAVEHNIELFGGVLTKSISDALKRGDEEGKKN